MYEPKNENENPDNIIDNNLWLIMKFLPKKGHEVTIGDVIRFGRIPFKVSKLVLDVQGEKRKERAEKETIQKAVSAAS